MAEFVEIEERPEDRTFFNVAHIMRVVQDKDGVAKFHDGDRWVTIKRASWEALRSQTPGGYDHGR